MLTAVCSSTMVGIKCLDSVTVLSSSLILMVKVVTSLISKKVVFLSLSCTVHFPGNVKQCSVSIKKSLRIESLVSMGDKDIIKITVSVLVNYYTI